LHPDAQGKPCVIGNCQAGWAVMILASLRPELFAGWLFTNKEYSRSPDLLPDLAALQSNIDVQRDLGFLKGPIDVQKYTDLSIVREAAQRLK